MEVMNASMISVSSYSCYCIDGYTGIQCQTNWDECWSGPCQNGGTCIDGVAYYNCTCPDGFTAIVVRVTTADYITGFLILFNIITTQLHTRIQTANEKRQT
ncbi:unnamed protein product [Ceratitis capitata]|uniref:(Mediterranean fruit fly) hypothetical protein n=1 Tax=Ceratitis capitata TaxID=7213 RepID=A0A811UN01_CERCA|nr:unnamed protein product [Ceratitis capitata]